MLETDKVPGAWMCKTILTSNVHRVQEKSWSVEALFFYNSLTVHTSASPAACCELPRKLWCLWASVILTVSAQAPSKLREFEETGSKLRKTCKLESMIPQQPVGTSVNCMGMIPASWPRHPLVQREHLRRDFGRLLFRFSEGTVSGPKLLQGKTSPAWRFGTARIALGWLRVTPASCWSPVRGSSQVCPATQPGPGPRTGHTVKLSQNVTVAQPIYQASHDWDSSQHRPCAPQNSSKAFSQCFHQGQNNNRTKKAMRPRWTDGQACAWSLDSAWLAAATLPAQWACKRTLERYVATLPNSKTLEILCIDTLACIALIPLHNGLSACWSTKTQECEIGPQERTVAGKCLFNQE